MRISAEQEFHSDRIALRMLNKSGRAETIVFTEHQEGEYVEPFWRLEPQDAQELVNALWAAGIRPEQSKQGQGAFEAQQGHLDDMRKIVFKKLGLENQCE